MTSVTSAHLSRLEADLEDVRQVRPAWAELADLVEGARRRGWDEEQIGYLAGAIGVAWAKATHRARQAAPAAPAAPRPIPRAGLRGEGVGILEALTGQDLDEAVAALRAVAAVRTLAA